MYMIRNLEESTISLSSTSSIASSSSESFRKAAGHPQKTASMVTKNASPNPFEVPLEPRPLEDGLPGSPPTLDYPDELLEHRESCEPGVDRSDARDDARDVGEMVPSLEKVCIGTDDEESRKQTEEGRELLSRIGKNLEVLAPYLEKAEGLGKMALMEYLADLGILQVTYDIGKLKAEGKQLDADYWMGRVFTAMQDKERRVDTCFLGQIKIEDPEEPMDTHQESPPESLYHYSVTSPHEWYHEAATPEYVQPGAIDLNKFEEMRWRLNVLEDNVATTHLELNEKIREIEAQMIADEDELVHLKWQTANLKKMEGRMRAGKKRNQRGQDWSMVTHRYPTRYSLAHPDRPLVDLRQELDLLTTRVKEMENRLEQEMIGVKEAREKKTELEALGPRIEELAGTVEAQRKKQEDTNSVLLSEVATFRQRTTPDLEAQLRLHSQEIFSLNERYAQLYTFAMNFIYPLTGRVPQNTRANTPVISTFPAERHAITAC